jgi:hypothetical protein
LEIKIPMTEQEIKEAILKCTRELGRAPSRAELNRRTGVPRRQIRLHFGSYANALRACNLERSTARKLDTRELFLDWASAVRALKKLPTMTEYEDQGRYSERPFLVRFRTWAEVPGAMKLYAEESGLADEWRDVLEIVEEAKKQRKKGPQWSALTMRTDNQGLILADRPTYGPLLSPCPLICGPTNENGVLILFGALAERLGFAVLHVQNAYPDGEAFRLVAKGRWQRVRIEFEYESRNFLLHQHDPSKCDLIVCWENNWPECPLEVIELKTEFEKFYGKIF